MERAWQIGMGNHTCTSNDDVQPSLASRFGIFVESVWSPMCRDDAHLMRNPELFEYLSAELHGLPVGLAAHDYSSGVVKSNLYSYLFSYYYFLCRCNV